MSSSAVHPLNADKNRYDTVFHQNFAASYRRPTIDRVRSTLDSACLLTKAGFEGPNFHAMGLDVDALLRVAPESACRTDTAIDPERAFDEGEDAAEQDSGSEEEAEQDAARKHYADVEPSRMRKSRLTDSDALDSGKYSGIKTSRAAMFGEDDDEKEDEHEDEGDEAEMDHDDDTSERGSTSDRTNDPYADDASEDEEEISSDEADTVDDTHGDHHETDDQADNPPPAPSLRGTKRSADSPPQDGAPQDLLGQIQLRQAQDAKKGRQVQKQIRAWEQALRTRIAMQKTTTHVGRLPSSSDLRAYLEATPDTRAALDTAAAELEDMANTLLAVRLQLWEQSIPALAPELSKVNPDASPAKALHDLEATLEPHRRLLLTRWSNKIAAAPESRNAPGAKLQLRAMNQGVVEQLDHALAGDGMARLVERTRVWRPTDTQRLGVAPRATTDARSVQDVDVFDDSDFYAQLLRDLVDNAGLVQTGTSAYAHDALQARKRKRPVDVRASKGRRIRYEVIEKVQNFMPPIPRTTWSEDQAQRLFARLAGAPKPDADEATPKPEQEPEPATDGFRLFA